MMRFNSKDRVLIGVLATVALVASAVLTSLPAVS
jgi:hypothetical protein